MEWEWKQKHNNGVEMEWKCIGNGVEMEWKQNGSGM